LKRQYISVQEILQRVEPKSSLLYLHQLAIEPYPLLTEFSTHLHTLFLKDIFYYCPSNYVKYLSQIVPSHEVSRPTYLNISHFAIRNICSAHHIVFDLVSTTRDLLVEECPPS